MQLGEAEALGVLDHHDVGVGHVDADLDHRRGHQDLEHAGGERRHGGVLGLVRHGAVQQADALAPKICARCACRSSAAASSDFVGALDQRAHPVDLRALGELRAQALDQPLDGTRRESACVTIGLRPGRLLGELRDVEVAVVRHQQRARDRRRRHDQHVGAAAAALGLQRQALVHAEAVLLVDDGEGQVLEHHVGLEQRVRADEDVDLAAPPAARAARRARGPSRGPSAGQGAGRRLVGERRDGVGMLARQHLGRRHQRGLRAGLDRDRHGHQRDDRLAGADIALQQAQHAARRAHVLGDLA